MALVSVPKWDPYNQSVTRTDKSIKPRFLRLTEGFTLPVLAERDAGGDKMETECPGLSQVTFCLSLWMQL